MGAIRDVTLSYNIPFMIGGISFLTSALMHFYLMWIDYQVQKQSKNQTNPNALDV